VLTLVVVISCYVVYVLTLNLLPREEALKAFWDFRRMTGI